MLFVDEWEYYDICERFPTVGNEEVDTTSYASNPDGHPSQTIKKSLLIDNVHDENDQPSYDQDNICEIS